MLPGLLIYKRVQNSLNSKKNAELKKQNTDLYKMETEEDQEEEQKR